MCPIFLKRQESTDVRSLLSKYGTNRKYSCSSRMVVFPLFRRIHMHHDMLDA
jgi:hypothetical protein